MAREESFLDQLEKPDTIYKLGGGEGGWVYKHSRDWSAKVGLKAARAMIRQGLQEYRKMAITEAETQLQILHGREGELSKTLGNKYDISSFLSAINNSPIQTDDIEGGASTTTLGQLVQMLLDMKKNALAASWLSQKASKFEENRILFESNDITKDFLRKQAEEQRINFAQNFNKLIEIPFVRRKLDEQIKAFEEETGDMLAYIKQLRSSDKKKKKKVPKEGLARSYGQIEARLTDWHGPKRLKSNSADLKGVHTPMGFFLEFMSEGVTIPLDGGWKVIISNLSQGLQGGGDSVDKSDTQLVVKNEHDVVIFTFTVSDKSAGTLDFDNLVASLKDSTKSLNFIPFFTGSLDNNLTELNATRLRLGDNVDLGLTKKKNKPGAQQAFRAAAKYAAFNSNAQVGAEIRLELASAIVWSGIIAQITGVSSQVGGEQLPLFVRHLGSFYKTSDLIEAVIKYSHGSDTAIMNLVETEYLKWLGPENEYFLSDKDREEAMKGITEKVKEKNGQWTSSQQTEYNKHDRWINLLRAKYKYIHKQEDKGTRATYTGMYEDDEVQAALEEIAKSYGGKIDFSVSLRIRLDQLTKLGA